MPEALTSEQAASLLQMRTPGEVEGFLSALQTASPTHWKWRPLGDRVANASNVEVLTEPGPPVVERITNGIDAMLELHHQQAGSPEPGPASPRLASEQWFGIPGGTLLGAVNGDRKLIASLAPNVGVDVYDSGEPKRPSLAILDRGIGQHPDDLPHTILSLGASNKIGKQYLCGAYGQGGSATFAWCPYTIIVSRRRPEHTGGRPDLVGWTIVRKYDDIDLKLYTYQYLVTSDNKIPVLAREQLAQTDFEFGTYIMHVAYQLGRLSAIWSKVGYRYLNNLLFDPVLPYTIHDHREPNPQDRYMYGSRGRLAEAAVAYSNECVADLGADGILAVRYWVFHERRSTHEDGEQEGQPVSLDSYLEAQGSSRTVVVTLNGQRHAYLDKSFIKQVPYPLLADSLLVQVDCDNLSRLRKKDLFPATRSGIMAGEGRLEVIERCVEEALKEDQELRRLEQERVQRRLATIDEESERKVKRLLDQLISMTRPLAGPGAARKGGDGQVPSGKRKFKPKDPPTYFRFAEEDETLRIEPGSSRVIDLVTDGPNDMLTRKKRRGTLTLETIGDEVVSMRGHRLQDGRLGVTVTANETASVGSTCNLRAVLEMDGGVYFATQRTCVVAAPPPPYVGQEPPTNLAIVARSGVVRLRKTGIGRVVVETDCRDDLLSRPKDRGRFEVDCSISGIHMVRRRGPHRGIVEAYMQTPHTPAAEEGQTITARLVLADGSALEDTKPCLVVEPPPPRKEEGTKPRSEGNYKIIDVWRQPPQDRPESVTWEDLNWNETHVGKYDVTQDGDGNDLLLLYINLDNDDLVRERERRLRRSGEPATRRLENRYKAYIGHHLWLHCQRARQGGLTTRSGGQAVENGADNGNGESVRSDASHEGTALYEEMRRVGKTVILAMRSEADLFASLAEDVQT
jgi:hypothetical protein